MLNLSVHSSKSSVRYKDMCNVHASILAIRSGGITVWWLATNTGKVSRSDYWWREKLLGLKPDKNFQSLWSWSMELSAFGMSKKYTTSGLVSLTNLSRFLIATDWLPLRRAKPKGVSNDSAIRLLRKMTRVSKLSSMPCIYCATKRMSRQILRMLCWTFTMKTLSWQITAKTRS